MNSKYIYLLLILTFVTSCTNKNHKNKNSFTDFSFFKTNYAEGFKIGRNEKYTLLEVYNPWQQAKNIKFRYILSKEEIKVKPDSIECIIKTPVHRAVCLSTTHIAFIDALGQLETIKAISGATLVSNEKIRAKIKHKDVFDIGYDQSLNYELIISLKPDLIFAYGVGADVSGTINRLKNMGIKVVMVSEYLETHPLAKAEWIKFFAEFFDKQEMADSLFNSISNDYNATKSLVDPKAYKPKVISSMPWNGTWYVSGGKSYAAMLINDAGGDYLWNDLDSKESLPIDYETVYQKSLNSDIWINIGAAMTLDDIEANDNRLKNLRPFKTGQTYNFSARVTPEGGNDYWESGTVYPNIILKDLLHILHPELLPDYKLYYYKKLDRMK